VLTHVYNKNKDAIAVSLENSDYWLPNSSSTFHGRDIFSPVAGHLASGVPIAAMGPRLDHLATLQLPSLTITSTTIKGEVIRIDHFGNALTNIMPLRWLDDDALQLSPADSQPVHLEISKCRVTCGWHTVSGLHHTYSDVPAGQPVALISSGDGLEIAVNQGNACQLFAIKVGSPVTIQFG
jgi:hypothetical protein